MSSLFARKTAGAHPQIVDTSKAVSTGCFSAGAAAPRAPPPAAQAAPAPALPPPGSPTRHLQSTSLLPVSQRVRRALAPDPLAYVHALLEGAPVRAPTARPSSLQPLQKRGQHMTAELCRPRLSLCGTQLADLPIDRAGRLAPMGLPGSSGGSRGVAQCQLSLGTSIKGVPQAGIPERQPCAYVLRASLYDGCSFHGAAQDLRLLRVSSGSRRGTDTWRLDAAGAQLLVRCPAELLPRAQVYLEFCVSHALTAEEAARLPAKPERAARQADEVCVAWALVSLSGLPSLHAARSLKVPLCGGPLAKRMTLQQCGAAAQAAAGAAGTAVPALPPAVAIRDASLGVKLTPLSSGDTAAAALLPAAAVVAPAVAKAVGCYRQLMAEALATAEGPASLAPTGDPVLAGFPALLEDADLAHAFFGLWSKVLAPRKAKNAPPAPATTAQLALAFRQCVLAVWGLLGAQALPPRGIANHVAQRSQRAQRIQLFLEQHPAVGLGGSAHAWLHRPFDASELRVGPLEGLGATV